MNNQIQMRFGQWNKPKAFPETIEFPEFHTPIYRRWNDLWVEDISPVVQNTKLYKIKLINIRKHKSIKPASWWDMRAENSYKRLVNELDLYLQNSSKINFVHLSNWQLNSRYQLLIM